MLGHLYFIDGIFRVMWRGGAWRAPKHGSGGWGWIGSGHRLWFVVRLGWASSACYTPRYIRLVVFSHLLSFLGFSLRRATLVVWSRLLLSTPHNTSAALHPTVPTIPPSPQHITTLRLRSQYAPYPLSVSPLRRMRA